MTAVSTDAVMQQIDSLVRRGAFKPLGRYLKEEDRDDRLAEAVGLTIEMALRNAAKGKLLPDAILVHHAKQRAVDMSRHLVPSRGRGLDAMNNANFVAGDNQLLAAAVRRGTAPEELLSSAVDLTTWLNALHERDHQLLCLRAAGFSLKEISAELRTSISMVFARCKRLGLELAPPLIAPRPTCGSTSRVYDDCPDHRLPSLSVCDSCMRPLCRKCKATRSRCVECRAAAAKQDSNAHIPGPSAASSGSLLFLVVLIITVMLVLNWKGCPGLPKDIIWLKSPRR